MTAHQDIYPNDSVYDFYIFVGTVVESSRWNEMHVSGGGGGGAVHNGYGSSHTNSIQSQNIAQGEIWLRDDEGYEDNFRFSGIEVPSRTGHRMAVIGVRLARKPQDSYQLYNYLNLTMDRNVSIPSTIEQVINKSVPWSRRGGAYSVWLWLGASALSLIFDNSAEVFWPTTIISAVIACIIAWRITGPQEKANRRRFERLNSQIIDALHSAHKASAPEAIPQISPQLQPVENLALAPASAG